MLRQTFLILSLITLTGVNAAQGQWNYQEAKPQKFTSTRHYVVAVGEELKPEEEIGYGNSGKIPDELDAGKVSRDTQSAFARKGVELTEKVSVEVQRKGEKWLITNNKGEKFILIWRFHRHDTVRIYRPEIVKAIDIYRALENGQEVRLKMAYIEGGSLKWPEGSSMFEKDLYFIDTTIAEGATVQNIKFIGVVNFSGSHLPIAVFYNVEFEKSISFHQASVERMMRFNDTKFNTADFSGARFAGKLVFGGDFAFSESVDFRHSRISQLTFERSKEISAELDFSETHFESDVNFEGLAFEKEVKFSRAKFKGLANFKGVQFSEADFFGAAFNKNTDFSGTKFRGKGDFGSVTFCDKNDFTTCGKVDFTAAVFSSQARFSFAKFLNPDAVVSYQGAQFQQKADFSYAEINTIDFSSYTPLGKELFKIDVEPHYQELNDGQLSENIRKRINKHFTISDNTSISVIEGGKIWLINDEANQLIFTVINEQITKSDQIKDQLILHLRYKGTQINQLSLIGTSYTSMRIDSRSINRFVFDKAAFQRFLKNQKEFGHEPFEYENAVLAFKRFQRSQKWFLTRWLETVLFDWTTQYGTAKIPWGLVIYAAACIFFFTGLYRLNPSFLMFVKSDGSVDASRNDPGLLEIFWFSGNTFIPAIEFLNAGNWRPKYDAMFSGGFIRYATIATIERILGWAMVPALLSYF
jgi:uncharacterized protein YjbI with pentapeptide repeats